MTKRNWRNDSLTWGIAEAIVGVDAKDKAKRNIQLKIVYPFMFVLLVTTVVLSAYIVKRPVQQECQWAECNCYEDNPYHYHCTVHGDGHDCY